MRTLPRVPLAVLVLGLASLQAQELRLGLGVFNLAKDGKDVQVDFRPKQSHWQVGFTFAQWTDIAKDPFTGRRLTETTETRIGPFLNYLFRPEAWGTWYLGGSVLRCTKRELSLITGEVGRDSATGPFVGGGFTGGMGRHFYYNLGFFLGPGTRLNTKTSVSSEQDSGSFDIQAQMGVRF